MSSKDCQTKYVATGHQLVLKGKKQKPCPCYEDSRRYYCLAGSDPNVEYDCPAGALPLQSKKSKKHDAVAITTFYKQKNPPWLCAGVPTEKQYPRELLFNKTRFRCPERLIRHRAPCQPNLGCPIGIAASTFSLQFAHCEDHNINIQGFATCLIAFAEQFITPECSWDSVIVNHVLLEGQKLTNISAKSQSNAKPNNELVEITHNHNDDNDDDAAPIPLVEDSIERAFVLCGNCFHLGVSDALVYGFIGDPTNDCDTRIPRLHSALKEFFETYDTSCLVKIADWYLLIWRNTKKTYFVFDCFGRRFVDLQSSHDPNAAAMLICLKSFDNVSHLLHNMSGVASTDPFSLRLVKIEQLVPCVNKTLRKTSTERPQEFQIIDENYAILAATTSLASYIFGETRLRQSLPVGICALLYSKIDPPSTWTTSLLDEIIYMGDHFYKSWSRCDHSFEFHIKNVPPCIKIGQFIVDIIVTDEIYTGSVEYSPNYRQSEICMCIKKAFDAGHKNLIIQIESENFALWKKNNFYYLLDPYGHGCMELATNRQSIVGDNATLRMCRYLDVVCCIFTQAIIKPPANAAFSIHIIRVVNVEEVNQGKMGKFKPMPPLQKTDLDEVRSLNETILWDASETLYFFADDRAKDDPGICICDRKAQVDDDDDDDKINEEIELELQNRKSMKEESDCFDLDSPGHSETDLQIPDKRLDLGKFVQVCKANVRNDCKELIDSSEDVDEGDGMICAELASIWKNITDEDCLPKLKPCPLNVGEFKCEFGPDGAKRDDEDDDGGAQDDGGAGGKESKGGKEKEAAEKGGAGGGAGGPCDDEDDAKCRAGRDPCTCSMDSELAEICGDDIKPNPHNYPGMSADPKDLVVVGSENGGYGSLCNLIRVGFKCADRILTMTPWGNFLLFKGTGDNSYFVFDGCTCNVDGFRYLDLRCGTAGLLHFKEIHDLITYIRNKSRKCQKEKKVNAYDICKEYGCDDCP